MTEIPVQTVTNDVHVMEAKLFTVCELVLSIVDDVDYEKTALKLHLVLGHLTVERMKKTIMSGLLGQDPSRSAKVEVADECHYKIHIGM